MLLLYFLVAVIGTVIVAWGGLVLGLAVATRRSNAKRSRVHQEALSRISTEEIESRAQTWAYLEEHAETEAVRTFRALLAARQYDEILRDWKHHSSALWTVAVDEHPGRPEFIESGSDVALRDYVEVLSKRQRAQR